MESVKIDVCVRPYRHDVLKTIKRKPVYQKSNDRHVVTYNKVRHELKRDGQGYLIWVDEE